MPPSFLTECFESRVPQGALIYLFRPTTVLCAPIDCCQYYKHFKARGSHYSAQMNSLHLKLMADQQKKRHKLSNVQRTK